MNKLILISLLFFGILQLSAQPVIHRPPDIDHTHRTGSITREAPTGDEIVNPAEFGRTDGIFLAWAGWDIQLITDIAYHVSQDYYVYLLVSSAADEAEAYDHFHNSHVNLDNVIFILDPAVSSSSMWIRDYAPFFIKEDGTQAICDFYYGTYWTDDNISYTIADHFDLPLYDSPLLHHGGNHISDGNRMGFFTTNVYNYNGAYSQEEVDTEFKNFFGFDSLVVVEPMQGDGTSHIDMFCKLLSDTLFIVGEYGLDTPCYPGDRELLNELAEELGNLTNLDGRPFKVERMPMAPYTYGGPAGTINYTYTNSLIVNDLVLVPVYGFLMDEEALQTYQELMPDHRVIGINSSFIIEYWGAVHCVTNEYFSENPLIILHDKLQQIENGESPVITWRLNPKFIESYASVYYRTVSENDFTEILASLENGIWRANLPEMVESFEYYISGSANSGEFDFTTTLPEEAPYETFYVQCTDSNSNNDIPNWAFNLRNYPNPFNPNTVIHFQVSGVDAQDIELGIYNLKGQKVKSLSVALSPESSLLKGSAIWDGTDFSGESVSTGIYLYRLEFNNLSETKRMVLLK